MNSLVAESSKQISSAIALLRSCSQTDILPSWYCYAADISISQVMGNLAPANCSNWEIKQLDRKGHIPWSKGQQVLWLVQKLVIPESLQDYPLAGLSLKLALTWWAESAQVFVNGQLVQEGDLFDCSARVLLSPQVTPQQEISVAIRLVSPSHDEGALVRSLLVYESNNVNIPEPGFIADELTILQHYLTAFQHESLASMEAAVAQIDWLALPDKSKFERSLMQLRSSLEVYSQQIKQQQICLLGHAHLDLAWLWAIDETWEVAQRTFTSVLQLQQEYPNLTFCHSTPAIYNWIEQHRPDLFTEIQKQVLAGRWEVVGGLWVEPELNLIAGESIVRQLLYGQRYVLEKFGKVSSVAWLPDTFGFCATLPQILVSGGIEYFVTQKLQWNDTTKFPHGAFWWRSPDGTELFSLMSAPIGEGIDAVKMASFSNDWESQTKLQKYLWLPGVGDHGGGPTRDMLELAGLWQKSPFFPTCNFATAEQYLQDIRTNNSQLKITSTASPAPAAIPTWDDELYLEFHRGCYTTHADQKLSNRRCETLLYQAELFAALATISADTSYPKVEIEQAWKKMLVNQFHDILPGSSIPQVFVDADAAWQEVEQVGTEILQTSLNAIASQIALPQPPQPDSIPLIIFNALNWQRNFEVVSVPLPNTKQNWQVYNVAGEIVPTQLTAESTLLFLVESISSVGYCLYWLCPTTAQTPINTLENPGLPPQSTRMINDSNNLSENHTFSQINSLDRKDWVLENEFIQVIVDSESGNLTQVFDKVNNRKILNDSSGNQLQAFQDSGQYWDAWNIDPNYSQHPLPAPQLKSINWVEQGEIQSRLRVVRQIGKSEFCQDYVLPVRSPILKIATTVDWQERQVLVKAAFPLNLSADYATYEIPFGAISRTTKPTTPQEQAKWEVPALRWADLSDDSYGVSLLNDCKYGYDSKPNQLRLTLLRSASWPDPEADKGHHEFTYAIYPHAGNWQTAQTVRQGYQLNTPLQVIQLPATSRSKSGVLPSATSLLNISADNLVLTAFKQAEDNPQQWIMRCYECHGLTAENVLVQSQLGLAIASNVDILERSTQTTPSQFDKVVPWKIVNFVLETPK
ncbi:alpha-mannosidase [Aliterella atlantica]|uniref:Alpha-mannosidase n=1 Tax=Aliterella atlantica CENA595 TaxID=1618023 RepID=A0A0D8ZV66_9CYAN|nr:alpha-mannosidase [Aliterella atlantica]KJH72349.1 alpha-mannosidase [Aliterella atlantica CENA595]